jgi:hypothetical protein
LLRFGLSFLLFVVNFRAPGWRWRRHAHDPVELPPSSAASSKHASRRPDLRIDILLENMTREEKL